MTDMSHEVTVSRPWFKSSLSAAGNSVEVQFLTDGSAQVRNGRDHGQGVLTYTPDEWRDFLGGARRGEFDDFGQTPTDAGG
jgi:hypothetical protein